MNFNNKQGISDKVYYWLATRYQTDNDSIKRMLDNQVATVYLLIWPIMEQEIFSGFMKKSRLNRWLLDMYSITLS